MRARTPLFVVHDGERTSDAHDEYEVAVGIAKENARREGVTWYVAECFVVQAKKFSTAKPADVAR